MPEVSLSNIVFYQIEKSIKKYRTFAQNQINKAGYDITIDQWLLLKTIHENNTLSQREISEIIFKDFASVTRMIELLVKKGYLIRTTHTKDGRLKILTITQIGLELLADLQPLIHQNRTKALKNIGQPEIENLSHTLLKIIENCD